MSFSDHFSEHAGQYARFRPGYPDELIRFVVSKVAERGHVWDCATGNGQAAVQLAPFFEKVSATDASEKQLHHAKAHPKVEYLASPAEQTSFTSNTFDLITIAQALHWFDFEKFFPEVRRVAKDATIVAAWGYEMCYAGKETVPILNRFFGEILGSYWPDERRHVDASYRTIPWPFEELPTQRFEIQQQWDYHQFIAYLRTWSSVRRYINDKDEDPVVIVEGEIKKAWGDLEGSKKISWPVFLKLGRVHK